MTEQYKPSPEEITLAESSMTKEQKAASDGRETILTTLKTGKGGFKEIQIARQHSIPEQHIKDYALRVIITDIKGGWGHEIGLRIAKNSGLLIEEEVHNIARKTYAEMYAANPTDELAAEYLFGKESPEWQEAMWLQHERKQPNPLDALDLRNLQVIDEILVKGDPNELDKLAVFYNLYPEEVELYVGFARLRQSVHLKIAEEIKARQTANPKATKEELALGAYKESLESQVREAILLMRKKGYPTFESGFYGPPHNVQKIGFEDDCLSSVALPETFTSKLQANGILIEIKKNAIKLTCGKMIDLSVLTEIWNTIAQLLPDRGHSAAAANINSAKLFRAKQKKL